MRARLCKDYHYFLRTIILLQDNIGNIAGGINMYNGADFLKTAKQETGITIKVINGETEAKLG